MVMITLQYIPLNFEVAFLRIKQDEIKLQYYQIAFFAHVYTSVFVLLAGFTQFSDGIRRRYRLIHRGIGIVYIGIVLIISAPSGFVMGIHANGGISSQIAFCLLSIFWFYYTLKAFLEAKKGNFEEHKKYMFRSYALALSAITLRLWKWIIVSIFEPAPMDVYRIVAWLGWILNLVIVEFYLLSKSNKKIQKGIGKF